MEHVWPKDALDPKMRGIEYDSHVSTLAFSLRSPDVAENQRTGARTKTFLVHGPYLILRILRLDKTESWQLERQ